MTQTHDLPPCGARRRPARRRVDRALVRVHRPPPPLLRARPAGAAAAPALLLVACLGAGATGAGLTALLQDDGPAAPVSAAGVARAAALPVTTAAGTPESAAAAISPSVVTIAVTGTQSGTGPFGQAATQQVSGTGSGIVLRADGYIVTNNHVVSAAVDGGTVSVTFSDGTTSRASDRRHRPDQRPRRRSR